MDKRIAKKRFFLNHKKSSALVVSVIIHVAFVAIALTFVAVQVYIKPDQTFEVKDIKRPKMQLRKLQVPVKQQKRTQAPKLRKTIVTKQKTNIDIKMPEIVGIKGGTGYGSGGGLGGLGMSFDMDLFGGGSGKGDEFIGTFYDLKQTPEGKPTNIGEMFQNRDKGGANAAICKVIDNYVSSGFNPNRLKEYFKAPKLKYTTIFMMPSMAADAAPKAFGVDDQVKPSYWLCSYKGQIAAPESGRYRFCGLGDDVLLVRVGGKLVLDACWVEHIKRMSSWLSRATNNRLFPLDAKSVPNFKDIYSQIDQAGGYDGSGAFYGILRNVKVNGEPYAGDTWSLASRMVIGDWFELKKGQKVDVDILIGEIPGGRFMCRLMIEQEGKSYKMVECDVGKRPVLPAFKTATVDEKLISKMNIYPDQVTLEGPVFGVLANTKQNN